MTEEEAATKLCCGPPVIMAMMAVVKSDADSDEARAATRCSRSACMAWRWNPMPPSEIHVGGEAVETRNMGFSTTDGRCGLAGAER